MSYPSDPQAVDLMIGFPLADENAVCKHLRAGSKPSREPREGLQDPAARGLMGSAN
ncbi:MAG: hypothetical protein OXF75_00680 [Acidimicrobiaceae bacterium]|nr:hypothetical protein [Acidimicrobiaceae bacterium]